MRGLALGSTLSLAFVLGALVMPFIVAPLRAQPVATGRRWEHQCVSERAGSARGLASDVTEVAQRMGAQGWELVTLDGTNGIICFKRPR